MVTTEDLALVALARRLVDSTGLYLDGRGTEQDVERARLALLEGILDQHMADIAMGMILGACDGY